MFHIDLVSQVLIFLALLHWIYVESCVRGLETEPMATMTLDRSIVGVVNVAVDVVGERQRKHMTRNC